MKSILKAGTLGATAALALISVMPLSGADTSGSGALNQIGKELANQVGAGNRFTAERTEEILGKPIIDAQGQRAGKLDNLVVDLDSGRVLYAIVTLGGTVTGETVLVPPGVLATSGTNTDLVFNAENSSVQDAPRWTRSEKAEIGSISFVNKIYDHFSMKPWWTGAATATGKDTFGNVQAARTFIGSSIKAGDGASLGSIKDLVVDVSNGWVVYAVLSKGGLKGELTGNVELYPLPSIAITKAPDGKTLTTALNAAKLQGGPHFSSEHWPNLNDKAYAQQVYQYYGMQPGFLGSLLSPTGR
jgi:sporulation protein YlmC with PRC-barrel domain